MSTELPPNYYISVHENWDQPFTSVFTLVKKRRFLRDETIFSLDMNYIPHGAARSEIRAYLTALAWRDKNGD